MPAAQSRGHSTRASVIFAISDKPGITEEEIVKRVAKSKGTVRNILGVLRERELVATKRAPSRGRGPGPLEYRLNLRGRRTAETILEEIESEVGARGSRRSARSVYVFVKKGTNVAALTKDGRVLRVTASAVDGEMREAKRQLGKGATSMSLADFLRTFYPDGRVDG